MSRDKRGLLKRPTHHMSKAKEYSEVFHCALGPISHIDEMKPYLMHTIKLRRYPLSVVELSSSGKVRAQAGTTPASEFEK